MPVRPYRDTDLERVARVHARSRHAAYDGLMPGDALAAVTPESQVEVWRDRLALGATLFVGEREGEVLGFAALLETDEGTGLHAIHLLPEALGTGLGSALMRAAVEHARGRGKAALHLFVVEGNQRAREFYERGGWRLTGPAGTHDVGGAQVAIVRYALELSCC